MMVFFHDAGSWEFGQGSDGEILMLNVALTGVTHRLHVVGAGTGLEGSGGFHSCVRHLGYRFHSSALSPPLWLS